MTGDPNTPWNILMGYAGVPPPPAAPTGQATFMPDISAFPPNITGDRLLAIPVPSPTSSAEALAGNNNIRWGQLGLGALKAAGGGLAATAGADPCATGLGCLAGAPMMGFGAMDALQGATMAKDALNGRASQGYNPARNLAVAVSPKWGDFGYDAASAIATGAGAAGKVPLVVDPSVTGISTTKSPFGVRVPQMDNSVSMLGKVFDSNTKRALIAGSAAAKMKQAYKDYPGN